MTFSSIMFTPGLIIWHSTDLVNWEPVGAALDEFIGSVWAPDFIEYKGTYYIYFPALGEGKIRTMVVTAPSPEGPWCSPVDVGADGVIDPGHIVDEEGQRYLFFNKGLMVRLSEDGLKTTGEINEVYSGWKYPEEWDVECFCLESPKLKKIGDYYYLLVAQGGTAGVPTSHMAAAARSKSVFGPWKNSPFNPIVHTFSGIDKWWSVGHGSLIDTPEGDWYIVYHGYLNGYYNLGRQTLMEPVHWTKDGWFSSVPEVDRAKPIRIDHKINPQTEPSFPDDFSTSRIGTQWQFFKENHSDRCRFENKTLSINATGSKPSDCNLTFASGDKAYEMEVEVDVEDGSKAGLLLFYNESKYCGISFSHGSIWQEVNGQNVKMADSESESNIHLKIKNNHHSVSMYFSHDGQDWKKLERSLEVSQYNHNAYGGFLSLRPGIFATGEGMVQFKRFNYSKL
jgi:beta-xylosidase